MNEQITIPKNYEVESCEYLKTSSNKIKTQDHLCRYNGELTPLVNTLIPGTQPILLSYITYCAPGSIKGPHIHTPPKYDRFICIKGSCILFTRNEQTKEIREFNMKESDDIVYIPPYNSHAIISVEGCKILNLCSEGYFPGHYNQIETEFGEYDYKRWLND